MLRVYIHNILLHIEVFMYIIIYKLYVPKKEKRKNVINIKKKMSSF